MITEREKWNRVSGDYQSVFKLGINEYNTSLLQFLVENGMLMPGCRVIDIGCGVGKYGTYLAGLGCDVTLTDISDKMIQSAKENMAPFKTPWAAIRCDFNDITGSEEAFSKGFDLAISTMSPAIHDVGTVRKMSRMTHGWCFAARFYDRQQPFRDAIMRAIGLQPRPVFEKDLKADCAGIIRAVSEAGYMPMVKYVDYDWSDKRSVSEMADYMYRNYFSDLPNKEILRMTAFAHLKGMCDDRDMINDNVNTRVAWIYWNTEEKK